jgi:NDP-sugar pyrophosphorylase family protein
MKLYEILKNNTSSQLEGTNPTLTGQGLEVLIPFFKDIEEFEGKNIEIIDSVDNLLTVKGVENLQENIKIQTIFLINNDVFIRCSSDSLKTPNGDDFFKNK